MPIPDLPARIRCSCGAVHTCDIQKVICGKNALAAVPELLAGYGELILVRDGNTAPAAADTLVGTLAAAGHTVCRAHFDTRAVIVPDEAAVAFIQGFLTPQTAALVGVGSGVINDLCKYVSCAAQLPYLIVATAPSMDGYASKGAAMTLGGMKVTTSAPPPRWIVGDSELLATAPTQMLRSGIGDILGKFSCLADWKLSALINGETFCQRIYDDVLAQARMTADDIEAILARDPDAVCRLFEGLVLVGVAMSLAGNSRPASGSEHHLAHFYEIAGLVRGFDYMAHGIDVGHGAVVTCTLRHALLDGLLPAPVPPFSEEERHAALLPVYGSLTGEVEALQRQTGFYDPARRTARQAAIRANRTEIDAVLAGTPTGEEMAALLARAGFTAAEYRDAYGPAVIGQSIAWAKDLKDRYTFFNLLDDLDLLRPAADWYVQNRV